MAEFEMASPEKLAGISVQSSLFAESGIVFVKTEEGEKPGIGHALRENGHLVDGRRSEQRYKLIQAARAQTKELIGPHAARMLFFGGTDEEIEHMFKAVQTAAKKEEPVLSGAFKSGFVTKNPF